MATLTDGWAYLAPTDQPTSARAKAQSLQIGVQSVTRKPKASQDGRAETSIELRNSQAGSEDTRTSNLEPPTAVNSPWSTPSRSTSTDYVTNPFVHRYGRRFLNDPSLLYPLPVDLAELHRQTLRTEMLVNINGAPFCSPFFKDSPPTKVLELACGSGFWSSACHDYFKSQGDCSKISFTGLDIAPLAPDLSPLGLDWQFVRHDVGEHPLPFREGEFDFIFIKDASFCRAASEIRTASIEEYLQFLRPGGVLEVWESDYEFRTLLPHPSIPSKLSGVTERDIRQAEDTATYLISPSTAFAKSKNKFLQDYNTWVKAALEKRSFTATPCTMVSWAFTSVPDKCKRVGSRRVAIPFGEVRWEQEGIVGGIGNALKQNRNEPAPAAERQSNVEPRTLTEEQAALRRTALATTIQFMESLEILLKEESGKTQDEWDRWWAGMTNELIEQNGTFNGECLETGAWWCQKI